MPLTTRMDAANVRAVEECVDRAVCVAILASLAMEEASLRRIRRLISARILMRYLIECYPYDETERRNSPALIL